MDAMDLGLRELYFNVNGGYMSMEKLYRDAVKEDIPGVTRKKVKAWLETQNTYIVHKPTRVHFKTQRTYVDGLAQQLQLDLVDMQKYSRANKGYKWILTSIEILSRYAFVVPAYRKGTKDMVPAVEKILDQFHERFGRYPKVVQFDEGSEFYNNGVKALLERHDIHYFSTRLTGKKAAVVERFNRTLKTRMWKYFTEQGFTEKSMRWIDVLDNFIASYNHSKHRTIGMKPADVNETSKDKVWTKLYGYRLSHFPEPKFKVGDRVRYQIYRDTFVKGYTPNYSDDVYIVSEVFRGDPNMYKLIDPDDDDLEILGRFCEHELSLDLTIELDEIGGDYDPWKENDETNLDDDDFYETALDDLDRHDDQKWLLDFKRQNENDKSTKRKRETNSLLNLDDGHWLSFDNVKVAYIDRSGKYILSTDKNVTVVESQRNFRIAFEKATEEHQKTLVSITEEEIPEGNPSIYDDISNDVRDEIHDENIDDNLEFHDRVLQFHRDGKFTDQESRELAGI
ncbi:uncharacterized transposon-derived [Paramuricea clavata]|uniref:Uncharacterized transposon-derived n=1 Tax=Paramuricea clavata TaxID=317549 RepID=A0A7D9HE73_PARCT|nr:uncharacterized transposon-derived [Paramuricea clavata]